MPPQKLSVVLPVRNREHEVRGRVADLIVGLGSMVQQPFEVVVVDDGSRDGTVERLHEMATRFPMLRVLRHDRPRGMEAAGQTGLERSVGDWIFLQEADTAIQLDDLRRLLLIAHDSSVLAARAQSRSKDFSPALIRRIRCYGTDADRQIEFTEPGTDASGIQFIRRKHLQALTGPKGKHYRLQASSGTIHSVHENAAAG